MFTAVPARAHAESSSGFGLVAHRGSPTGRVTENTIPSFRRAVGLGATAVELDVHLTRDERLVVMHDASMRRTTTCAGPVHQRTLKWIQHHCRGRSGRERIPSLTAVLGWASKRQVSLLIELKRGEDGWTSAVFERLWRLIERRNMGSRVALLSFSSARLRLAERTNQGFQTQWIAPSWNRALRVIGHLDGVNLSAGQLTARRVRVLRRAGLRVLARFTNRRSAWRHLARARVDGLLTDDVDGYRTWRRTVRSIAR